ncbi:MAG: ABC transporter ATP-binding protein [Acidimicrobiia bacterium]
MMYSRFGGAENRVERPFRLLRRAAGLGRHLLWPAVGGLAATILATLARLAGPLVVRAGIDDGIAEGNAGLVTTAAVVYLGLFVGQYVTQRLSLFLVGWVGERYLADLRVRVFRHLMSLDIDFFSRSKTGVLVSRMTSDIEALTEYANEGAVTVITNTLTVVGVAIAMLFVDVKLALVVLSLLPLLVAVSAVFRVYADRAYQAIREQIGRVLGTLQEGITGVRVVQAYTQEEAQAGTFGRVNQAYYDANVQAAKAISFYFPAVDFLATIGTALVLLVGGTMVLDGSMSFGTMVAFLLYLAWFFEPIVQLSNVYNLQQAALAALSKLFEILDQRPAVRELLPGTDVSSSEGVIGMESVDFSYDEGVPVLQDIDLSVAAGERVALVGETGAGKSTLAKLAVRFYDPDSGEVTVDGVDLREASLESLRRTVALVPQEGFLFSGSLRDNLRYARPDMSDDELWDVCERIGISDWVRSLPERLDTDVRERGSRLSAGERQLVSLARALAAAPAVIVLDEATSNLDPGTEARIDAALRALLAGRTAIVIAHRIRTAERADRVLVVEGGRIVEQGTPEELGGAGGPYARLRDSWERTGRLAPEVNDEASLRQALT